ncbi:nucleotidyl transferase AbiEii/AbiGii toxin family protein [Planctomycetota bacterium]
MSEPIPLATVQTTVFEFLRHRDDAVVFGAHAVNAYVEQVRMTQDVDILSDRAEEFAKELRDHLHQTLNIAVRQGTVAAGMGIRLFQIQNPKNRHLVDIRHVDELPASQRIHDVLLLLPSELIAQKVLSMVNRRNTPKGMTDVADLRRLLLTFPELKAEQGEVADLLRKTDAADNLVTAWQDLVAEEFIEDTDDY